MDTTPPVDFSQLFIVTSITREDLKTLGYKGNTIAKLTDYAMRHIAHEVEEAYIGYGSFWEDLRAAIKEVLALMEQEDDLFSFFSDPAAFATTLPGVEIAEVHSDDEEEARSDIELFFLPECPYYLILRDGLCFHVVYRCGTIGADYKLQVGAKTMYVCYYRQKSEIVDYNSQDEALAFIRSVSEFGK